MLGIILNYTKFYKLVYLFERGLVRFNKHWYKGILFLKHPGGDGDAPTR